MQPTVCVVPGGDYPLGDMQQPLSSPAHTVRLAAFFICQQTVSNAQFAGFVTAGGYQDPTLWTEAGWRWQAHKQLTQPGFWQDGYFNDDGQPVVGVGWYEAAAYANWLARISGLEWRLPTEAEWEAAARGIGPAAYPNHPINSAALGTGCPWPHDPTRAASWCGAQDLLGNVWEWTNTRWGHNWQTLEYPYPYDPTDGREDQAGSPARVMRGGSWFDPPQMAHPAQRARYLPGSRASNIGFRLARSL